MQLQLKKIKPFVVVATIYNFIILYQNVGKFNDPFGGLGQKSHEHIGSRSNSHLAFHG